MRLIVKDDKGSARIQLLNSSRDTIGLANMPWHEYEALVRSVSRILLETSREAIKVALGKRLWEDAQRLVPLGENSAELAQARLLEFGWTAEMIESYADELAKKVVNEMVGKLPEHR